MIAFSLWLLALAIGWTCGLVAVINYNAGPDVHTLIYLAVSVPSATFLSLMIFAVCDEL